ncbi:hypothetical protein F8279_26185, partial [Micromonospora sp. AMSO1212t]
MSRSSTPGSPAGRPAGPTGNRARSFDYPPDEDLDEVVLDSALVTSPGHSRVGVFQPPRPLTPREPVRPDGDIDSPFLDLFGGAQPRRRPAASTPPAPVEPVVAPPRRGVGREPLPIPHQPAVPVAPVPRPEPEPPAREQTPGVRVVGRPRPEPTHA